MGYWRRHPQKDMEGVLEEFDKAGWIIESDRGYYKVKCPCGSHMRSIHLTPSNPRYGQQALRWMRKQPCYQEGGKA